MTSSSPRELSMPAVEVTQFRWLIHSWPKIGKTVLASFFPNVVFFATEQGTPGMRVHKFDITSWADEPIADEVHSICGAATWLKEEEHNFKTVVIDTIELAYKFLMKQVAADANVPHVSKMTYGAGWDQCNQRFHAMLEDLFRQGLGVVMCSHTRTIEEARGGLMLNRKVPNLSTSPREVVTSWADHIIYLDIEPEVSKDGEMTGKRRVAICQPRPEVEAGGRLEHMPEVIELPSPRGGYENLHKAFVQAVKLMLTDYGIEDQFQVGEETA